MLSDKKAAKKIIKVAKKHPDWYNNGDIKFAKVIKKRIKNEKRQFKDKSE
tara:strand:+ start:1029 stop:1178 length:150 start_codon:yes stop_codon:yes gene_type:complete